MLYYFIVLDSASVVMLLHLTPNIHDVYILPEKLEKVCHLKRCTISDMKCYIGDS